jgi:ribosome biogenesis protein SSF1/2
VKYYFLIQQKKRTHVKKSDEELKGIPKSMVIHLGTALENHTLTKLVRDARNMMQPHTAIRLRERKSNKLKDFVVMAGPLGITYLMLFSQNEKTGSTHLRLSSMPRGPTISFKILEYSLCKDISRIQRNPKSISASSPEFLNPPLLVMNGFTNPKDASSEEKLIVTMFQNMFPPISPMNTKVGTIKRVLLLNKDKETGIIELRHYVIETKLVDVSRNVKKLINIKTHLNKKLPNLSKTKDVADIILDPYAQAGFTSDSEVEDDSIVEVNEDDQTFLTRQAVTAATINENGDDDNENEDDEHDPDTRSVKRKKAVKLTEIGPRMKLGLVKIEDGVCGGKILYHSHFKKTKSEINKLEQRHAVRRKEKEIRKKQQAANVAKKSEKKLLKKQRREERKKAGEDVSDDSSSDSSEEDVEMSDYSDIDDINSDSEIKDDKLFDED